MSSFPSSVEFRDADQPGLLHVFHSGCEGFAEMVEKWRAGYRVLRESTGEFLRGELAPSGSRYGAGLVTRAQAGQQAELLKPPAEPKGKRGSTWDLSGAEVPGRGRDRTSLVVRMSLPMRSELLRLAAQSDEDDTETGGFLFGRPSYGARGRVIEITSAVRAAKDRERWSFAYDYSVLRSHLNGNDRLRIIGDFHTHPESSSASRASHEDRVVWLQHLDLFRSNEDPRLTEWLSLILAVDPRSTSMFPTRSMYAWVTRRDRAEGPLTEKLGFQW